jgi:hypothetical protein
MDTQASESDKQISALDAQNGESNQTIPLLDSQGNETESEQASTAIQKPASFSDKRALAGARLAIMFLAVIGFGTFRFVPFQMLNTGTALAVATLILALVFLPRYWSKWQDYRAWAAERGIRLGPFVLASGLGLIAAIRFGIALSINGVFLGISLSLWCAGWILLLFALRPQKWTPLRAWFNTYKTELIIVGVMTLIGAGLRFYALGELPRAINGDEGLIGTWAQDIGRAGGALVMPFAAIDGVGTIYLWFMQQIIDVFGPVPLSIRLMPAIAGVLAIPAVYLFAREVTNPRVALIASALLTVSHVHVHFSRQVAVSYIYTTLSVPLSLYFLLTAMERRSAFRMVLSVLMIGIHINFYIDGWVWLVLIPLVLIAWFIIDRSIFRGNLATLLVGVIAAIIIIAPMALWGFFYPNEFASRMSLDGTFASGWLEREVASTGKSPLTILLGLGGFALATFYRDPFIDFYGIGVPTFDVISRVFWGIGLILVLIRTWNVRMVMLNGWFWGGVVALAVITIPPSTYHYRLLVVFPVACIFVGIAIDWVIENIEQIVTLKPVLNRYLEYGVIALFILAVTPININTYYGDFLDSCKFVGRNTRQADMYGTYLYSVPKDAKIYVLPTEIFRYGTHRSVDYLSNRKAIQNIEAPLAEVDPSTLIDPSTASELVVVTTTEREGELKQFENWFPNGEYVDLRACETAHIAIYKWKPASS